MIHSLEISVQASYVLLIQFMKYKLISVLVSTLGGAAGDLTLKKTNNGWFLIFAEVLR